MQASTSITGVPMGTLVEVKYRPVLRTGEGDWSGPVSLLVR